MEKNAALKNNPKSSSRKTRDILRCQKFKERCLLLNKENTSINSVTVGPVEKGTLYSTKDRESQTESKNTSDKNTEAKILVTAATTQTIDEGHVQTKQETWTETTPQPDTTIDQNLQKRRSKSYGEFEFLIK
ncbi:hypothetical protein SNE40_014145 [Patella caerulea]|uniref:Uncharacterized protein n=1 Tax=Patella caerulea TaxID=87958 RepID=A0AAN8PC94_PATCE